MSDQSITDTATRTAYFKVEVQDGERSQTEHNLDAAAVLDRVAVPFRLKRPFRINGFEFRPGRIKRFRITKSANRYDPATAFKQFDMSSFGSAFSSLVAIGAKEVAESEEVTDEVLKMADQQIVSLGLKQDLPGAFGGDVDPDKAFVVMSFAERLAENFEAIRDACAKFGVSAARVDEEMTSAPIVDRILSHLCDSNYIIADLTDARPNVYYEIGYFDAVCRAREIDSSEHLLLVAQNVDAVHFDLKHRGIEEYSNPYALMKRVDEWLLGRRGVLKQGK